MSDRCLFGFPSRPVDWRLWFGPGVRLPPEALHPRRGDPVVPITRAAARSQGENYPSAHFHTSQEPQGESHVITERPNINYFALWFPHLDLFGLPK